MPRAPSQAISCGTSCSAAGTSGFEIMPTVLMVGIEEKFLVPFSAENRTFHDRGCETVALYGGFHAYAGLAVQFGRSHDAAFTHLPFPHFELWFDEYNHRALGAQNGDHGRQNQRDGDEADVQRRERHRLADIFEPEVARIQALMQDHARIRAQFPIE